MEAREKGDENFEGRGEPNPADFGIIGTSPALMSAWKLIVCASRGQMSVHIEGETGTGKELFAAATHLLSKRRSKPYIIINCATLNNDLAMSELFGHRKGAFTGAVSDRRGAFEEADGGSIFLDEVSELRPETQAKLLRVLESRTIRRVGENTESKVDVRIISASNAPLRTLVQQSRFREDLFQRLCCFEIHVPPLRERRADILPIAERFLAAIPDGAGQVFSEAARKRLLELSWCGNVRELRNVVERSKIVSPVKEIAASLIQSTTMSDSRANIRRFRDIEVDCLRAALDKFHGNIRATALALELAYSTVRAMLIRLKLDVYARNKREEHSKEKATRQSRSTRSPDDLGGHEDDPLGSGPPHFK